MKRWTSVVSENKGGCVKAGEGKGGWEKSMGQREPVEVVCEKRKATELRQQKKFR